MTRDQFTQLVRQELPGLRRFLLAACSGYESRLPEYHYKTPSPIPDFSSYEDIVNEIECSGRQLENAIAQL